MKGFKLIDDTGITLKEAIDGIIENFMLDYDLTKRQARKLLAETVIRHCVYQEIAGEAEWLMGREEDEDV